MAPTVTTSRPASWPGPPLRQLEVRSPRPAPSDRLLPLVSKRLWPARKTLVSSKREPTLPLLSACVQAKASRQIPSVVFDRICVVTRRRMVAEHLDSGRGRSSQATYTELARRQARWRHHSSTT